MLSKLSRDQESNGAERAPPSRANDAGSLVSRDLRVVGDCETDGSLRVEGKVTGDVRARALEITSSGSVDGDVEASEGPDGGDMVVIHGRVDGAVRARRVEIRPGGSVHGGVTADEALVHGRVRGGIVARTRLVLEEAAEVEGDVRARRLALKEGGQVNGNIRMGEKALASEGKIREAPPAATAAPGPDEGLREEATVGTDDDG